MTRVAFRIDASANSGTGHLARCATLAKELARRGAQIVTTLSTEAERHRGWLESEGMAIRRMPDDSHLSPRQDAQSFLTSVADCGSFDWIVVDHYGLDDVWESAVRERTRRILVMDDFPARKHDCDLLVDQNLRRADSYVPYVPSSATVLAGPRFALLRDEFRALHIADRRRGDAVRRVLICFGGADPSDHTSATVEALQPLAKSLKVTVVLGAANANRAKVVTTCRTLADHEILASPPNLPTLLAESDLVIGAGGIMTWERACVGVPTIAVGIAANQVDVLQHVLEDGYALGIPKMLEPDVAALRALIVTALRSPAMVAGMARRALTLVDGKGARRVADAMLPKEVTFRAATSADSDAILRWRNHPSIRAVSLDQNEIDPQAHRDWMEATLRDSRRTLLIAEQQAEPIGVVRFDFGDDVSTISLYRVPGSESLRAGMLRNAIEWLHSNRPEITRVVAHVRADNARSLAAFRAAGFRETAHELVRELRA